MSILEITPHGAEPLGDRLAPILARLAARRATLARVPIDRLLALLDEFALRLAGDPGARMIEGVAFLSAWLRRANLERLVSLNLGPRAACLDGFVAEGSAYLAARPHGLVAMWLAGNVPTLPMFSLVPALLGKNVCLAKLARPDAEAVSRLLAVLAQSRTEGLAGEELLGAMAIVWFDYRNAELSREMSSAADARMIWGGSEAVEAVSRLPRPEHCVDLVFGPKYSIGVLGRRLLEGPAEPLDEAVQAFVRDVAAFDQRACSSPQTIFVERNHRRSLRAIGERFARFLARLPVKPEPDFHTTSRILAARAEWAMDAGRDVIASGSEANWTVCLDRDVSLKEAVQSRTVFLTEVESWREVIPLISPKVQTIGIALGDLEESLALAEAATAAGAARCVRPGLMNHYESPWDGKLVLTQLVRWVTLKP